MTIDRAQASPPREYVARDREVASALLGDARVLDVADTHVHVSGKGAPDGLALWIEPTIGQDEAYLGPVIAPGGPGRRSYELVLACANDAMARGYERAYFTIKDGGLVRLLRRTFRIDPVAAGWEPEGGTAREWEVHVELRDAVEQLREVIGKLRGGRS